MPDFVLVASLGQAFLGFCMASSVSIFRGRVHWSSLMRYRRRRAYDWNAPNILQFIGGNVVDSRLP